MDVDPVSRARAAFEAVQAREPGLEAGPILAARTGLAPLSSFTGRDAPTDELLRAALRERAILRDVGAVLTQPEQALHGVVVGVQAGAVREPDDGRARREASAARTPEGEQPARLREERARSRFSQTRAVEARSGDDLVAHFGGGLDGRRSPQDSS